MNPVLQKVHHNSDCEQKNFIQVAVTLLEENLNLADSFQYRGFPITYLFYPNLKRGTDWILQTGWFVTDGYCSWQSDAVGREHWVWDKRRTCKWVLSRLDSWWGSILQNFHKSEGANDAAKTNGLHWRWTWSDVLQHFISGFCGTVSKPCMDQRAMPFGKPEDLEVAQRFVMV